MTQLLLPPTERDIAGLAHKYGISVSVAESDLMDFATTQMTAGRLVMVPLETARLIVRAPRRGPSQPPPSQIYASACSG